MVAGGCPPTRDRSTPVYVARQTIAVSPQVREFEWDTDDTPGAVASSGLPVSFGTVSPACVVQGSHVHGAQVGDCTLVANQAGNTTYGPAPPAYFYRSVVPASQTLTAPPIASILVGGSVAYAGSSSAGLPVETTSASPDNCAFAAAQLHGLAAGTCRLRLTQVGSGGVRAAGSSTLAAVSPTTPTFTRMTLQPTGEPSSPHGVERAAPPVVRRRGLQWFERPPHRRRLALRPGPRGRSSPRVAR